MSSKHYHIFEKDFFISVQYLKDLRDACTVDDVWARCLLVAILVCCASLYLNWQFPWRDFQRATNLIKPEIISWIIHLLRLQPVSSSSYWPGWYFSSENALFCYIQLVFDMINSCSPSLKQIDIVKLIQFHSEFNSCLQIHLSLSSLVAFWKDC